MNTSLAIILTIVVTNWTHIGDFKDTAGKSFDVQEGRLQTNTVADVEWREQVSAEEMAKLGTTALGLIGNLHTNRFILKSVEGPIIGERRIEITNVIIIATNTPWSKWYNIPLPIQQTNNWYLTNVPVN